MALFGWEAVGRENGHVPQDPLLTAYNLELASGGSNRTMLQMMGRSDSTLHHQVHHQVVIPQLQGIFPCSMGLEQVTKFA